MTLPRSVVVLARTALIASLPFWLSAAVGCGDDGGGGGGGGTSGAATSGASGSGTSGATSAGTSGAASAGSAGKGSGGSSTAGSSNQGGKSGGGGVSGSGSGGSNGGKGGGSNVEPGQPCTANCPTGSVQTCFDNCPIAACDEGGFYADEPCSTYYPAAISSNTIFCAKNQTATYCLTTLDKLQEYWVVTCAAGTPTVKKCDGGCGADANHVATCNE